MINNNRSESVAPAKGSEKVANIRKELEELGSIKESLVLDISTGKKLASDYEGLEQKVLKKTEELKAIIDSFNKSNNSLIDLQREVLKLQNQKEEYNKIVSQLGTIKSLRDNHQASFDRDIKEAQEKLSIILFSISEKESKINELKNEEQLAIDKLADVNAKCQSELDILTGLKEQNIEERQHAKLLAKDVESSKKELEELKNGATLTILGAEEHANNIITGAKQEAENIMNNASDYKNKIYQAITLREGECSYREKQLNVREEFLRDIKSQLEDKLGKKIDNLVF